MASDESRTNSSNNDSSNIVLSKNSGFRVRGTKSSSIRSNNNVSKGPPLEWLEGVAALSGTTLLLMARQGPTVFVVKDESGAVYKVVIGQQHRCSCRSENPVLRGNNRFNLPVIEESGTSSNESTSNSDDAHLTNAIAEENSINNIRDDDHGRQRAANERTNSNSAWCKHLLFCLIKVLKIPKEHPLCYQNGLTDSEIDQVLNYGVRANVSKPTRIRAMENKFDDDIDEKEAINPSYVARQSIAESSSSSSELDSCPICQDDMTIDQCLTWCRTGCGNNMHAKCMLQYCQFKTSNHQQPGCPLCRENWNMELLQKDCQAKDKKKVSAPGKSKKVQSKNSKLLVPLNCANCTCLVRNIFHRCLECSTKSLKSSNKTVDLCGECFNRISHGPGAAGGVHASHRFLTSTAAIQSIHDVHWTPCKFPIHGNMSATYSQQQLEEREAIISNIQSTLAERELNMNDYELLLNLDGGGSAGGMPEISNLLVDSLSMLKSSSKVRIYQATTRCWCESQSSSDSSAMRKLPCEHTAHEKCLKKELLELLTSVDTSAFNGAVLCGFCCHHSGCEVKVFPHLNRRKEVTIEQSSPITSSTLSTLSPLSLQHTPSDYSINIAGNGLHVAGIGSSSNNSSSTSRSQPNEANLQSIQQSRSFYSSISAGGIVNNSSNNPQGRRPVVNTSNSTSSRFIGGGEAEVGMYVRGLQSHTPIALTHLEDRNTPHAGELAAIPSAKPTHHLLQRPPRPHRHHPPSRLQPMSLLHNPHLENPSESSTEHSLLPQVLPSRLNSKQQQSSNKPPLRLPSMGISVDNNNPNSHQPLSIDPHAEMSTNSYATGLRSGSEKRIQVNKRSNSNVRKVGEILLQRIINNSNEDEHNAVGNAVGGGNFKDYTPMVNDDHHDVSSLAVHSVPLGRKGSASRMILNNGEDYLSDMEGDVNNMRRNGGRLKKGISNIQPMQHGDKHRQTSRSDHNLLSVSNAKHYSDGNNET